MKNILAIIIGAIVFFVCASHLVPSHEPASTLQWWTYGMFAGLGLAAAGVYGLKKQSDENDND
jgi:cytosine/uracil/thiamine/allantoin permease